MRSLEKLHIKYNASKHLMYYFKCFSSKSDVSILKTVTYIFFNLKKKLKKFTSLIKNYKKYSKKILFT